jgi:phosphoglycolate phosphatase-like HAD superfamily hydrolase
MIFPDTDNSNALIMLDLDGTLIDTSELYFQGVPRIVKQYMGIDVDGREIRPMWGQFARKFFDYFARSAGRNDQRLVDMMYEDFCEYYNAHHNRLTTVYPGVNEQLGLIGHAVHAVGVVTTRPVARSAPVLLMPWVRHIDFFVWGDQVARTKPHPDGLEAAIGTHATDDGICVYAGDNPHDMDAARACRRRVIRVAALWGAMNRESLLASGHDIAFETFEEFTAWITAEGFPINA